MGGWSNTGELVRALGLEPVAAAFSAAAGAVGVGLEDAWAGNGIARLDLIAERPGAAVLLVELSEPLTIGRVGTAARWVRRADGGRSHLLLVADGAYRRLAFACFGLEDELRHLVVERDALRPTDLETLAEMVARPGEGGLALALRWSRALDRTRVTARFFADFSAQRSRVAGAWSGVPQRARADRNQLALLFLCRLMFLYFLQRPGHLADDPAYVSNLFRRWRQGRTRSRTFFRSRLIPLFFGALNTRPEQRTAPARRLGSLPYLNGGLFERTAVERRHGQLDLSDDVVAGVFEHLLDRYRFTTREAADDVVQGVAGTGVDPAMLGRVFEGLMSGDRRGETGTFFTPAGAVDGLVAMTLAAHVGERAGLADDVAARVAAGDPAAITDLDAAARDRVRDVLHGLRILDPACGSGAFLLGALSRVSLLRARLEQRDDATIRRDIVARALHGVDVQADAALLCALRLWLALTVPDAASPARLTPLPNLDRRIRQGDALLDPLDLAAGGTAAAFADRGVRRRAAVLAPLAARYIAAEPGEREALQRALIAGERELACAWIAATDRGHLQRLSVLRRRAAQRDLWGQPGEDARDAAAALQRVDAERSRLARMASAIEESHELPFFSFAVHFAETALSSFDIVVTNPPWVRAHRWPATVDSVARRRYRVCTDAGWREGARLGHSPAAAGAQVDLALLFLEKSISLLADRGSLGMLLPARILRSLYGGGARRMLLREMRLACIDDYSLHQHSIFAADAFATTIVATRPARADDRGVSVSMHRKRGAPLRFSLPPSDLPLMPGDEASPWLLAPPPARAALRAMQQAGEPLGRTLRIRRGIFTGANDVLMLRDVEPRLGNYAWVRAEGAGSGRRASDFEALIEADAVRPLLRGCDVRAWRYGISRHVIWLHGDGVRASPAPPRLRAYLELHRGRLDARTGLRPGAVNGALFRVSREALGAKVVWHDLAATLQAVAIPAAVRSPFGRDVAVVPLNTVYFVTCAGDHDALLLSALLNALPMRTFARSVAERAKDARFRFFAWTVGALPLPVGWRTHAQADRLVGLARTAHSAGAMTVTEQAELDERVASLFGLDASALDALREFDAWLSGTV